jgi:hypothetical protein
MLWLAPLLGFLLTLPSVLSGYVQDDHVLRRHSLEAPHAKASAWGYFCQRPSAAEIAQYRERGINQVTWWTPATARACFFRPLASLLHASEFRLFGDAPWVMHVHRALLYALIVFLGAALLARLSSTPIACGIACLLFAMDDSHAYSSGWISAANTLLTCVFGLFALLMHDRWRRQRSKTGLVLSLVEFVLSLLSSEGGLALMGYLVAYALFLDSGSWKERIASLVPATFIAVGYLVFYAALNLGVKGSFDYLSPTEDLWQAALVVLGGTVTGTVSQVLSIPMLGMVLQMTGGVMVGAVLLAALIALFRDFLRSSKTVAFFGAGMVISIVPFAIGMMGDRYLLWAGLGSGPVRPRAITKILSPAGDAPNGPTYQILDLMFCPRCLSRMSTRARSNRLVAAISGVTRERKCWRPSSISSFIDSNSVSFWMPWTSFASLYMARSEAMARAN